MTKKAKVRLFTERGLNKRFLEAFFRKEVEAGLVRVEYGVGQATPIIMAQTVLLERPGSTVAVVSNTETTDEDRIERELRGPATRLLHMAGCHGWHVALAVPRIDAWAMLDPRIKADFEAHEETRNDDSFAARAARIGELTKAVPFDADWAARENEEFRGLLEFVRHHTRA